MAINKSNGVKKTTLIIYFIVLLLPLTASAYAVKKGDSVYVPKGETVEGNLYAAGSSLTIEGKVTGDVICAGQSINISGEVAGDVICAGQSININGKVGGNLRVAGASITLNGQVARNAMAFGASIITAASSSVGWDLLAYSNTLDIVGNVGRDLYGGAARANVAGQVGKNLDLNFGNQTDNANALTIAATAKINGDVKYTSNKEALIENGAAVKGSITHNLPVVSAKESDFAHVSWWWGKLISIFSALVIGLVLISFWREQILKITDLMLSRIGPAMGWGVLALLLTPIVAIILLITIIGIPLSLILVALWFIAFYLSKILVGILIGRSLLANLWAVKKDSLILAMILGIVVAYLIFSIPIIGWFVSLLAILWGLGGIMLALKNK